MKNWLSHILFGVLSAALLFAAAGDSATAHRGGQIRQYYIAADELDWDYMPSGTDMMMGMPGRLTLSC
jgi:hypothetical protein